MGRYVKRLDEKLKTIAKASYPRYQYQSFMTGPEWRNVEMAEELAAFLRENNSIFQFPYFRQVADLWRVFYNSYSVAREYDSAWNILTSEYMVMDIFITLFTTLEMIPKGLISLILYPFLKKDNNSEMQQKVAAYFESYAQDLQTIPFYDHHYKENRAALAEAYNSCENKTWVDWFTWKSLSIELWARRWISKPLSYWFHQDTNIVEPVTDIIVKYRAEGVNRKKDAKAQFRDLLAQANGQLKDHLSDDEIGQDLEVSIVDNEVYARKKMDNSQEQESSSTYVYARLRTPRYALFQPVIRALADQEIHVKKIAGQDRVQVKCVVTGSADEDAGVEEQLEHKIETLNTRARATDATPLYTYGDRIHDKTRQVCLFDVPVMKLEETLDEFDEQGAEVRFIHNF
ncbi:MULTISPECIES: hypothetical protein [Legionella]|uniref:Uncharacterized protein n=1 Tax=Legionella drozanskii LLAP-1 TaxID=1212489 RepID=A0A0W0SRV8_9GAMM|nr:MULTISPECIES: hypothetical protein [Legionella]KTC86134.1 hypothetical protein Ldro_2459 [Legionella drozanskii LLAP-1]PJE17706.1 MAG: hypothetical protein CK430_01950 [Legionella sp.]